MWKPVSQPLATAYFGSAPDLLTALGKLFVMDSFFYPILESRFQHTPEGLLVNVSLNFDADARVSEVFDLLLNLAFHSICREVPGIDLTSIRINFGFERRPFFNALEKILNCKVTYGNSNPHTIYPNEFLLTKIGTHRPELNAVILNEIEKQANHKISSDLADQIKKKIDLEGDFSLTIGDVADFFSISPRTLQRQLQTHGTTFQEVVDSAFREKLLLLIESGASNSEIVSAMKLKNSRALNAKVSRVFKTSPRALILKSRKQ